MGVCWWFWDSFPLLECVLSISSHFATLWNFSSQKNNLLNILLVFFFKEFFLIMCLWFCLCASRNSNQYVKQPYKPTFNTNFQMEKSETIILITYQLCELKISMYNIINGMRHLICISKALTKCSLLHSFSASIWSNLENHLNTSTIVTQHESAIFFQFCIELLGIWNENCCSINTKSIPNGYWIKC